MNPVSGWKPKSSEWSLSVTLGTSPPQATTLHGARCLIGTGDGCDLQLRSDRIAPEHLALEWDPETDVVRVLLLPAARQLSGGYEVRVGGELVSDGSRLPYRSWLSLGPNVLIERLNESQRKTQQSEASDQLQAQREDDRDELRRHAQRGGSHHQIIGRTLLLDERNSEVSLSATHGKVNHDVKRSALLAGAFGTCGVLAGALAPTVGGLGVLHGGVIAWAGLMLLVSAIAAGRARFQLGELASTKSDEGGEQYRVQARVLPDSEELRAVSIRRGDYARLFAEIDSDEVVFVGAYYADSTGEEELDFALSRLAKSVSLQRLDHDDSLKTAFALLACLFFVLGPLFAVGVFGLCPEVFRKPLIWYGILCSAGLLATAPISTRRRAKRVRGALAALRKQEHRAEGTLVAAEDEERVGRSTASAPMRVRAPDSVNRTQGAVDGFEAGDVQHESVAGRDAKEHEGW